MGAFSAVAAPSLLKAMYFVADLYPAVEEIEKKDENDEDAPTAAVEVKRFFLNFIL